MDKQQRTAMRIAILGVLVAALVFALYSSLKPDEVVDAGDKAPNFSLPVLGGGTMKLSDLQGKPVVLNFWASWCEPCKAEMPDLVKQYELNKDKGVVFVGVDIGEGQVVVQQFAERMKMTFPILLDESREITKLYNIGPIPTTFFIDKDGEVVVKKEGQMNEAFIADSLTKIMP